MELLAIYFSALAVGLTGAMMPGPLLTITVSETGRGGLKGGLKPVLGHGILELVLVIGLSLGLSRVLQLPLVAGTIGVLGGLVLLWMGYGIVRAAIRKEVSLSLTAASGPRSGAGPVLAGVVTTISNPYWLLWWATAGAAYLLLAWNQGLPGLTAFYAGHISADLAWYGLVAILIHSGRRFLGDGVYRGILLVLGSFLVVTAVGFVVFGVRTLF